MLSFVVDEAHMNSCAEGVYLVRRGGGFGTQRGRIWYAEGVDLVRGGGGFGTRRGWTHLGLLVRLGLAQGDHLVDGVGVGPRERDDLAQGLVRAQCRQGHARCVLRVQTQVLARTS
eukprot:1187091-Prorocentrum_minimum.AAC.1